MSYSIHHGDAMDVLDSLDNKSVHAVVTDPPYGIAFMGEEWDNFAPHEYQTWCEEWARKVKRVLKPGGHLVAFSGDQTHHRLFSGVQDAGLEIRHTLIWLNGNGMPKGAQVARWMDEEAAEKWEDWHTALKPSAEFAVLARKPFDGPAYKCVQNHGTGALNAGDTRIGKGRFPTQVTLDEVAAKQLDRQAGERGAPNANPEKYGTPKDDTKYGNGRKAGTTAYSDEGGPSRFFYCPKAAKSERTHNGQVNNDHKTVKPIDLMRWLITLVSAPGQTVLDPFAGSGTTGVAALQCDSPREFIGVEKREEFVETTRKRLEIVGGGP